jgi:ATP-dependent helicase HrpB
MAADDREKHLACDLAALLSERDILQFDPGSGDADLETRLGLLARVRRGSPAQPPVGRLKSGTCRRVLDVARYLRRCLDLPKADPPLERAGHLLAWAYPDRIAQRREGGAGHFLLSSGKGAFLDAVQPLAAAEYLVAAALDGERRNARIFLAAALDLEDLRRQFADRMEWIEDVDWDPERQAVVAQKRLQLGALCLKRETLARGAAEQRRAALIKGIRQTGLDCLPWTRALRTWQARVAFLRRVATDETIWPDVSDAGLADTLEDWLGPCLEGVARLKDLKKVNLAAALKGRLSWQQAKLLDRLAPSHWTVPSGSRQVIDYSGETPVLAVRIQEMFGTLETPAIADGDQPLLLHLLSPAGRPAQITQDLAGFWTNSYPEVRKALKGRYPKHHWPEDPLKARPTDRAKPRPR